MEDDILPVFIMDRFRNTQDFSVGYFFVITGSLDPAILKRGLEDLVQIGHWRKIGARIRRNTVTGAPEYHVPKTFSDQRPAFRFTTASYISREDAGLVLPEPTPESPSIQRKFGPSSLFRHPETPTSLETYLDPEVDRPILNVHVVTFEDRSITCLGLTIPHIFADATGASEIMSAWLAVIKGGEAMASIPDICGWDEDPLEPIELLYEQNPGRKTKSGRRYLGPWEKWFYGLRMRWELYWYPEDDVRMVYLPGERVRNMREEALEELKQRRESGEEVCEWVSENDVVMGWAVKVAYSDGNLKIPLRLLTAASYRRHLPALFPPGTAYLHNALITLSSDALMPTTVRRATVAQLASIFRKTIVEQSQDTDEVKYSVSLAMQANRRQVSLSSSNWWEDNHYVTSWASGGFMDFDFSPALERPEECGGSARIFSGDLSADGPVPMRGVTTVLGRDTDGGYWLQPTLRKEEWATKILSTLL